MTDSYYCEKCNKTMSGDNFYKSYNLEKYPDDGKFKQCKKCMTMHVDNFNPDTYLWILQEADVPYVPDEWNKLMDTYGRDRSKLTGMTIIGRYLGKMRLNQYKKFRWKDTDYLREKAEREKAEVMKRQGYDAAQIDEAIARDTFSVPEGQLSEPVFQAPQPQDAQEDYFAEMNGGADDFVDELTDEERIYLRLKWGKTYKPEEWVKLEQLYEEMINSYDVQGAAAIDNLKLICKTSLKANQLIDIGDIEGFQKMSKVYDTLMKSGKFTAQQNKAESGEFVDSISELVEICEKDGFIPRFYIPQPNDQVDATLQDLKYYTHTLVTEEMNLGNLIESAIKTMAKEEAKEEDEDIEEELNYDDVETLIDEDFIEHNQFLEDEADLDEKLLSSLNGEDDI